MTQVQIPKKVHFFDRPAFRMVNDSGFIIKAPSGVTTI
jgi:hypothetical protein